MSPCDGRLWERRGAVGRADGGVCIWGSVQVSPVLNWCSTAEHVLVPAFALKVLPGLAQHRGGLFVAQD